MCPVCVITIGGGLLLAKKLGINNLIFIGLLTTLFSIIMDIVVKKINHGKVFFPYQRIVIPIVFLFITIVIAKFLI
jgi:hypothetical protein